MNTSETAMPRPVYKRKVKNYLLDVGLQLRYTATIVIVAVVLTGILGFRIYQATQDTSKVILWTGLVDPATAQELQTQFAQSDRTVVLGHHRLRHHPGAVDQRRRHPAHAQGRGPALQDLQLLRPHSRQPAGPGARQAAQGRRAPELLSVVHATCTRRSAAASRTTCASWKGRSTAIEATPEGRAPSLQHALDELRQLRKRKEDSLEAPPIDRLTTSGT